MFSLLFHSEPKSDTSLHTGELVVNTNERGDESRWLLQRISHVCDISVGAVE